MRSVLGMHENMAVTWMTELQFLRRRAQRTECRLVFLRSKSPGVNLTSPSNAVFPDSFRKHSGTFQFSWAVYFSWKLGLYLLTCQPDPDPNPPTSPGSLAH